MTILTIHKGTAQWPHAQSRVEPPSPPAASGAFSSSRTDALSPSRTLSPALPQPLAGASCGWGHGVTQDVFHCVWFTSCRSTHIVAGVGTPVLFEAEQYFTVGMGHVVFPTAHRWTPGVFLSSPLRLNHFQVISVISTPTSLTIPGGSPLTPVLEPG